MAAKRTSGRRLLALGIVGFWCVMAMFFLRREILPDLFALPTGGYASVRAYAVGHAQDKMGVYLRDGSIRIGTTETTYQLKENGDCEVSSHFITELALQQLLTAGMNRSAERFASVEFWLNSTIGPDDRLKSFWVSQNKQGKEALATGLVVGNELQVTMTTPGQTIERKIPISPDDTLSGGLSLMTALQNPRVGQAWQIRTIDPTSDSLQIKTISARVKKKTRILLRGTWYPVYEVELWQRQIIGQCWVSEAGEVLMEKHEIPPITITLIREPLPHELLRQKRHAESTQPASSR